LYTKNTENTKNIHNLQQQIKEKVVSLNVTYFLKGLCNTSKQRRSKATLYRSQGGCSTF